MKYIELIYEIQPEGGEQELVLPILSYALHKLPFPLLPALQMSLFKYFIQKFKKGFFRNIS